MIDLTAKNIAKINGNIRNRRIRKVEIEGDVFTMFFDDGFKQELKLKNKEPEK